MGRLLARLDERVAAFERGLIVALLAAMAGAVFLDATHRLFSASEGRIERLLVALFPLALERAVRAAVAPAVLALGTLAAAYGALKTRDGGRRPRGRRLLIALGISAAVIAGVQALVRLVPNGLIWSQQMGLCFMLWVGLTGASLAARDRAHLVFELAGRIWPARIRPAVEGLARLIAGGFSLFLALLAALYAREHYLEWTSSEGAAGLFEAFPVPRWTIFGYLPIPFVVTGLRFFAHGVHPREELPVVAAEPPR